jgi:hypothetical protein
MGGGGGGAVDAGLDAGLNDDAGSTGGSDGGTADAGAGDGGSDGGTADAGPGDGGIVADGGTCSGCLLAGCTPTPTNTCCDPGTTASACGFGEATCLTCPSSQQCIDQQCQTPPPTRQIGDPCVTNTDCASIGAGALCKRMTSTGNAAYPSGYCTIPCTGDGDPACGANAFCVGLTSPYGEADVFCWDRCSNGDPCRAPGYACYNVGGPQGCWLSPLPPEPDAGP